MNEAKTDANAKGSQVEGNIRVDKNATVQLGLRGSDSYWAGSIDPLGAGNIDLILRQGAHWDNRSFANKKAGAVHIRKLTSDADTYIMQNDGNRVNIDKLAGSTTIFYAHDNKGTVAADYKGGDIHVKSADAGSSVTVVTDKHDIDLNNADEVYQVLNTLAGKFFYDGHATGSTRSVAENNLTGTVKIAEGLTTPVKELKVKAMKLSLIHI